MFFAPTQSRAKNMFINLTEIWDSRHAQLAIYTVFDEESESEVEKCQILEPGGKIYEQP